MNKWINKKFFIKNLGTLLISKFTVTHTKNLRRKEFMYILQETYLKPVSFLYFCITFSRKNTKNGIHFPLLRI